MTEIPQALVEKAAQTIPNALERTLDERKTLARAVLAAVWPDVADARPVADREALAKALHMMRVNEPRHPQDRRQPCRYCFNMADRLLMDGVITDAADVRRQTADDIAAAVMGEAHEYAKTREKSAPHVVRALVFAAYEHAARLAREVGGDRG